MLYSQITIISNTFSLINRATCLRSKTCININIIYYIFRNVNFLFSVKRFEKFKKRIKFKLEIIIYDVIFK